MIDNVTKKPIGKDYILRKIRAAIAKEKTFIIDGMPHIKQKTNWFEWFLGFGKKPDHEDSTQTEMEISRGLSEEILTRRENIEVLSQIDEHNIYIADFDSQDMKNYISSWVDKQPERSPRLLLSMENLVKEGLCPLI